MSKTLGTDERNDIYALLRRSQQPVEHEISRHLDQIAARIGNRHQRFRAFISVAGLVIVVFMTAVALWVASYVSTSAPFNRQMRSAEGPIWIAVLFFLFFMWILLPLGTLLRARTSKINCDRDFLISSTGIFDKSSENVHLLVLSRTGPVSTRQTVMNRLTNDGTLDLGGTTLRGYFRKNELDELSSLFRQLSLLNPTSREVLAALGELKNIRSGAQ